MNTKIWNVGSLVREGQTIKTTGYSNNIRIEFGNWERAGNGFFYSVCNLLTSRQKTKNYYRYVHFVRTFLYK